MSVIDNIMSRAQLMNALTTSSRKEQDDIISKLFDGRNDVYSSWISSLGYDPSGDMEFNLLQGRDYTVHGIDPETYARWMDADSKGQFYHRYIKDRYTIS